MSLYSYSLINVFFLFVISVYVRCDILQSRLVKKLQKITWAHFGYLIALNIFFNTFVCKLIVYVHIVIIKGYGGLYNLRNLCVWVIYIVQSKQMHLEAF